MTYRNFRHIFASWICAALLCAVQTACTDVDEQPADEQELVEASEAVQFATYLPDAVATRATTKEAWDADIEKYKKIFRAYTLNIEMWKEGADMPEGSAEYKYDTTSDGDPDDPETDGTEDDGTLTPVNDGNILYWQDNVSAWGFKATAGTSSVATDQSSGTLWLAQDKLEGYGYVPLWDSSKEVYEGYYGEYNLNKLNYRTSKQWYADNKKYYDSKGQMPGAAQYQKIPIYLQHKRAWITIKLRAGEGVSREALAYVTSEKNISTTIHSYDGETEVKVDQPWSREFKIDYPAEIVGNLPAQPNMSSTRYDAIVEPYDYATNRENVIANIVLSGQKFSFSADCDTRYVSHGNDTASDEYRSWADAYNLTEGKHLTIDVTLTRESRKILITAWVEDWTTAITSTICDDYGNAGDPIVIQNKKQLLEFLKGPDNSAGTVAIIQNRNMDLDEDGDWPNYVKDGEPSIAGESLTLNAMLNVAGGVISSKAQFVDKISASGSILNGTFQMKNETPIATAIANENEGTLERITVSKASATAQATVAGLVGINYGTIYQCNSTLPVYGDGTKLGEQTQAYAGGIAALSIQKDASTRPIIDACFVNANVDGETNVQGGGIVGLAAGLVTNNTFEYGITLSQNDFKNIFHTQQPNYTLSASNNGWPTSDKNPIGTDNTTNINVYAGTYDAVIHSQAELKTLLTNSTYNSKESLKSFRISENFEVNSATWDFVSPSNDFSTVGTGNVFFRLNGNNKTITLTGTADNPKSTVELWDGEGPGEGTKTATITAAPMLFNNIMGEIRDLTLNLDKPVVANPSFGADNKYNANDAIAPLAYSIYGGSALISNVNVKSATGAYVQAATPAGLVVWALSNTNARPTIENCTVEADVRMWLNYNYTSTTANMYAGGIVAMASKAIVTQCKYRGKTNFTLTGAVRDEDYKTATDKYPANWDKCYYGGIVGGTTTKGNEFDGAVASLSITDCSSWYETSAELSNKSRGSIIGAARYSNSNHDLVNGMAEGNTGNWWPETSKGAAELAEGTSEEKAIGKRNSVDPGF